MAQKSGHIVTFYSYKGGAGRTMALSNTAWVLASNGHDVLVIDWDLEAPGLHRYLRPFLIDQELTATPGFIDFIWDAAQASITPFNDKPAAGFPSLEDYAVGLDWDFGERGSISFIPAGRQDDNYAQRVNTFNWDNFYERLGGGKILEAERTRLRETYDYIMIDSRTGVSDTSSICTVHMPDTLLVFFTLNRQSISGAAAVAHSIQVQRPDMPIFPVPTRIENSESDKRDAALAFARRIFTPFLQHIQTERSGIDKQQQAEYWNQVEIPYRSIYAFEEVPAAFKDEPGDPNSVLAPSERIAYWISGGTVSSYRPVDENLRAHVVKAFAFADNESPRADWAPAEPTRSAPPWKLELTENMKLAQIATAALAGGAASGGTHMATIDDAIQEVVRGTGTPEEKVRIIRELRKCTDRWTLRYVIWGLIAVAIIPILGIFAMISIRQTIDVPQALVVLAATALGALAAYIVPPSVVPPPAAGIVPPRTAGTAPLPAAGAVPSPAGDGSE